MELFAGIVFVISLIGIVCLFGLKYWEEKHATVLVPKMRLWSDDKADEFKQFIAWSRAEAGSLTPRALRFARWCIHELALGFASLARASEREAHRLADLVSHKHRFERRESTNEFLKQVSDHKNGNGVDTEA
jgi:hypothetical protein